MRWKKTLVLNTHSGSLAVTYSFGLKWARKNKVAVVRLGQSDQLSHWLVSNTLAIGALTCRAGRNQARAYACWLSASVLLACLSAYVAFLLAPWALEGFYGFLTTGLLMTGGLAFGQKVKGGTVSGGKALLTLTLYPERLNGIAPQLRRVCWKTIESQVSFGGQENLEGQVSESGKVAQAAASLDFLTDRRVAFGLRSRVKKAIRLQKVVKIEFKRAPQEGAKKVYRVRPLRIDQRYMHARYVTGDNQESIYPFSLFKIVDCRIEP